MMLRILKRYFNSHLTENRRHLVGFTLKRLLPRPFLGSTRSGTLCAAIPLSKSCARNGSREQMDYTNLLLVSVAYRSILF